jgi:light-regulated signal transduction histidine kinase (bacteriophytochrome)
VDLCAIVRDEADLHSHAAQTSRSRVRNARLRRRGLGARRCTATRQVVGNLLSNAVKFTDAGSITLVLEVEGDTARVTVEDTGIGIERAHLGEIFEPFRRVEAAGAELRDGTDSVCRSCCDCSRRWAAISVSRASRDAAAGSGSRCRSPTAAWPVPGRLTRDEDTSDVVSRTN